MKRFLKILATCAPLIIVALGVGLIMRLRPGGIPQPLAFAQAVQEAQQSSLSTNTILKASNNTEKKDALNSSDTAMLNLTVKSMQAPADIEKMLTDLAQKNRAWLSTPGWLHIVTKGSGLPSHAGEYRGKDLKDLFSSEESQETWTHIIDNQGNIAEDLSVSRSSDGRELQRAVTRSDGTSGNLTLLRKGVRDLAITTKEEKSNRPIQSRPTVEDEALGDIQRYGNSAATISGGQEVVNGRQVFVFSLEQKLGPPMQDPNLQEPIIGSSEKIVFDMETGYPVIIENQLLTEKGGWILLSRTEYLVAEIVPGLPDGVAKDYQQSVEELNSFLESGK